MIYHFSKRRREASAPGSLGGVPGVFFSGWFSFEDKPTTVSPRQRAALRRQIEREWQKARDDYATAGKPFGDGRGLDIWVEYGQLTTVN